MYKFFFEEISGEDACKNISLMGLEMQPFFFLEGEELIPIKSLDELVKAVGFKKKILIQKESSKKEVSLNIKDLPSKENPKHGLIGWTPGEDGLNSSDQNSKMLIFNEWKEFYESWKYFNTEGNTVVNYYFNKNNNALELNLWVLHTTKGSSRSIKIKNITQVNVNEIKEYLMKNFNQIEKWFKWSFE